MLWPLRHRNFPVIEPELTASEKKTRKKADAAKAKMARLLSTMALDTVTYEDAPRLLSLPCTLGTNSGGDNITVQNGRHGP